MTEPAAAASRRRQLVLAIAIGVLALFVRVLFLGSADVDAPLRGDVMEYWRYAWNMVHYGVFSMSVPGSAAPAPDAYRSPGYPAFLAVFLRLAATDEQALRAAVLGQVLVGALLSPLTMAIARRWLAPVPSLLAGLAVALWPHLVVFSSTMLSETVFCLWLMLFVLLLARAQARDAASLAAVAGIAAGIAWLVNPLAIFLPPLLALLMWARAQRRVALAFLGAFLVVAGAWSLRNSTGPSGGRASVNLVQGSYPLFLVALNDRHSNEIAQAYAAEVERKSRLAQTDLRAAAGDMAARFRAEPVAYLRWYLLEKPWALWDWNIRVGWGDVYFLQTANSPYERNLAMRATHDFYQALNPLVFVLALAAAASALVRSLRQRRRQLVPFALVVVALLCCYVTAVHAVFQAEPRYAVAYRPFEVLLAVSAVVSAWRWLRRTVVPGSLFRNPIADPESCT